MDVAHRPQEAFAHSHYVTHAKYSPGSQGQRSQSLQDSNESSSKRGWSVFRDEHRPSITSISSGQSQLVRSQTATTASTITSTQPLVTEPHRPFTETYGRCLEILHYGTNSTIRLHQKKLVGAGPKSKQLFAIKVYRHSILDTSKSTTQASHCSPSAIANLHPRHPNILPISDLLYNERSELCLVMPFCAGGDLHELLSRSGGPIPTNEADCLIIQILRALDFLHEHGTAHRDIRLETVLLTDHGTVKLAGFGDGHIQRLWSECAVPTIPEDEAPRTRSNSHPGHSTAWPFSLPWLLSPFSRPGPESRGSGEVSSSTASFPGMSLPYIPPERFQTRSRTSDDTDDEGHHDPRPADVWATAIVYLALITGRLLWRSARPHREDTRYLDYLRSRRTDDGYPPIESLGKVCDLSFFFYCMRLSF